MALHRQELPDRQEVVVGQEHGKQGLGSEVVAVTGIGYQLGNVGDQHVQVQALEHQREEHVAGEQRRVALVGPVVDHPHLRR